MTILNLTQHPATPEQLAAGVVDLTGADLGTLKGLLTFDSIPERTAIMRRARHIAALADLHEAEAAMIGGAPWLMGPLESELSDHSILPMYAFSVRETEEVPQPDGSVKKVATFRHAGFVESAI
jgi:hypothetical protein